MEGGRKESTLYLLVSLDVGCMKLIYGEKRHAALKAFMLTLILTKLIFKVVIHRLPTYLR